MSIIKTKKILGGAIGNCVHIAGIYEFLRISEHYGMQTKFLGASVDIEEFAVRISDYDPDIVCISYRLTADNLNKILNVFFKILTDKKLLNNREFYFGGTPDCVKVAKQFKYFSHFFIGEEDHKTIANLLEPQKRLDQNEDVKVLQSRSSGHNLNIPEIHKDTYIMPMIRHHFGLSDLKNTIDGIKQIAEAEVLDVISVATDQNAQEFFFEPEKMDNSLEGSGGVPVRNENDLKELFNATQRGNFPRLRIYSGTNKLLKWAELSTRTINNAWGTIPLFWYSELDGRSKRSLETAIRENMEAIKWYADRDIPVEINDPHHWSLRESADVTAVVDAYISAYNAKKLGVKKYIAQLMLNTPRLTSVKMDIAKMLAKIELINELVDDNFDVWKQVRAGLAHFSIDMDIAKGQLAASTLVALSLDPQIIHVVSFSEAHHAAKPEDVIESCKIVKGVLRNSWRGFPDLTIDPDVKKRKNYLVKEAKKAIQIMKKSFIHVSSDPLSDPFCLAKMVNLGMLDAPQLKGNPAALGKVKTMPVDGGYDIVDVNGNVLSLADYINKSLISNRAKEIDNE